MVARKHTYAGLCMLALFASSGCVSRGAPAPIPVAEVLQDDPNVIGGAHETLLAEFHAASIGADSLRGHLSAD